jgi:exopolyphosphatase / guanosine-5'-triphosphate,3'-diphosphate pyrophosphatase
MGSELVALLDIGSNAARFVLARITYGVGYRVLRRARVVTRLAGGTPGTLPRKGVKGVLRGAHRFLKEVRRGRDPRVVAVATSAVRDAKNSRRLLGPLRRQEGVEVEILSAREEARLGVLAAVESLSIPDGAIVDLGGGSLQITRVRRGEPVSMHSLPLGAVRLTRRFFKHDPPTSKELRRLRQNVREQLLVAPPSAGRAEPLIAMGGTARAVASMHLAAERRRRRTERHGLRLLPSELTAVRERLETLPERKRRKVRGLKADRAEIILGGVIVLEEVLAFGGYGSLVVCTRGVGDGILLRETFHGSA